MYIVPTQKFRGSRFVDKYYEQVMERAADVDPKRVFVTHCLSDGRRTSMPAWRRISDLRT